MRYTKTLTAALILATGLCAAPARAGESTWRTVPQSQWPQRSAVALTPAKGVVSSISPVVLQSQLWAATETTPVMLTLPMPDGSMREFKVWEAPVMAEALARRYSGIRTFRATAADNAGVTARLDYTEKGFHAMIRDGVNTIFIDPYDRGTTSTYISYYRRDYARAGNSMMSCEMADPAMNELGEGMTILTQDGLPPMRKLGAMHRTYRLALACTEEYATAVDGPTPTKPGVLSAMITSVNRVNSVYELEFAVTLTLVGNTDTLIFLPGDVDEPYTNNDGATMLDENQDMVDLRIGNANYDIGHVFSTGGGGIAGLGVVCEDNQKGNGVTGGQNPVGDPFDIDYVAHEMGHQFSGSHTFNASTGSCSGNGSANSSYEPGSGTTIMAYAGICGNQDLQDHSDAYFHGRSLDQIGRFVDSLGGSTCPIAVPTGNTPPDMPAFSAVYSIPSLTPFELEAPEVIDTDHEALTYCWEQWNRSTSQNQGGDFGKTFTATRVQGPIFRSFSPVAGSVRVFPRLDTLVDGVTKYLGEKLPDTNRILRFRLTVRDIFNGLGAYNFATDTIHLDVHHTGVPFAVTSPATAATWEMESTQTITWDVASTDIAPVSCSEVNIYLSTDGGFTYPIQLLASTPNDGSAEVTIPTMTPTTTARIKVKGDNNVFFNISPVDFSIEEPSGINDVISAADVNVYPVPATSELFVELRDMNRYRAELINTIGQRVWSGDVQGKAAISVQQLAKGVYYLQLADARTGSKIIKQVMVK
jgi:hypothetical protein